MEDNSFYAFKVHTYSAKGKAHIGSSLLLVHSFVSRKRESSGKELKEESQQ